MSKRIIKDIENAETLKNHGIYIYYKEENIREVWALIVGPEDSAYEGGLLFFNIKFIDDYPFIPQRVTFLTHDGRTRFHPNLYVEGKVCLSILGTWAGPCWTSTMSLSTILLSIQGLLDNDPMKHEPGWDIDSVKGRRLLYKEWVEYKMLEYNCWFQKQDAGLNDWQIGLKAQIGEEKLMEIYKKSEIKLSRLKDERIHKVYLGLPYAMGTSLV